MRSHWEKERSDLSTGYKQNLSVEEKNLWLSMKWSPLESKYDKTLRERLCGVKCYSAKDLVFGRQFATGSFSQVHIVTIKGKNIEVAGKRINETGVTNKHFVDEVLFLQLASEKCDNIVKLLGVVMKPRVILMEYHKNGSLDRALRKDYDR